MNFALIDLETTGLSPYDHEIIELGAVFFSDEDLNNFSEVNVKIKPEHPETGHPKAFEINGYTSEAWADAQSLTEVLTSLEMQFRGRVFMSYNVTFDWGFMAEAYRKTGLNDPFHYHRLDLMTMAWNALPRNTSISLKNVCAFYGIEPEPTVHRALNGAMKAYEVYKKIYG